MFLTFNYLTSDFFQNKKQAYLLNIIMQKIFIFWNILINFDILIDAQLNKYLWKMIINLLYKRKIIRNEFCH